MKNKTKKILRNKRRQRGGNECDEIADPDEKEECNEKYYKNFVKTHAPQVVGFIDAKLERKQKEEKNTNDGKKAGKRSKKTAKKMRS